MEREGVASSRYHRRSIRLRGWDYSEPGWYYITLVLKDREKLFGDVVGDEVRLSTFGKIVRATWLEIPKRFTDAQLDEFIIMPDHLHGIIVLEDPLVGAIHESPQRTKSPERKKSLHREGRETRQEYINRRRKMTLSKLVGWFKMNSSKAINLQRQTPGVPVWQRNYYEHIIRNDADLYRIRTYIEHNPFQWSLDEQNPDRPAI